MGILGYGLRRRISSVANESFEACNGDTGLTPGWPALSVDGTCCSMLLHGRDTAPYSFATVGIGPNLRQWASTPLSQSHITYLDIASTRTPWKPSERDLRCQRIGLTLQVSIVGEVRPLCWLRRPLRATFCCLVLPANHCDISIHITYWLVDSWCCLTVFQD